jgi:hypothetical protein
MPSEIRIYFEGDKGLKPGFHAFFKDLRECARKRRCKLNLVASGSGAAACRDFGIALREHPSAWNILLADSEAPFSDQLSLALCREHKWKQSYAISVFWMVETMESWFHADKEKLADLYGAGFKRSALKRNPKVEEISKKDLESGLREATRNTSKGNYFDNKTEHAAELLRSIRHDFVRQAAPNCARLFDAILARLT